MLKRLLIKNYILIEEIDLTFGTGLTVITGETGAGKSMLMDAVGLICGERASVSFVRKGARKGIVEGIFDISENEPVRNLLKQHDFDAEEDELIIRREISSAGKSRSFINDSPATLQILQQVTGKLIDLHGQHQHQSLLDSETYYEIVDEYAKIGNTSEAVRNLFTSIKRTESEVAEKSKLRNENLRKQDFLRFQLDEIIRVNPSVSEEAELLQEEKKLIYAEKLFEKVNFSRDMLSDASPSSAEIVTGVLNNLRSLIPIDNSFQQPVSDLEQASILIGEAVTFLRAYADSIEVNPAKLEQVQERLGELSGIKKKYGGSIEAVLETRREVEKEITDSDDLENTIEKLQNKLQKLLMKYRETSTKLSELRIQAAERITGEIQTHLAGIGLDKFRFLVSVIQKNNFSREEDKYPAKLSRHGIDTIEFLTSPGSNVDLRALSEAASGGEISRIMLAIKSVLARTGGIFTMIFDEIDQGVSGKIAYSVGRKMKQLADGRQVIVITHLPQMASMGDHHLRVDKSESAGTVFTSVEEISQKERIAEIAKLLGGEHVSDVTLKNAEELLLQAANL